jgi:cysteine desulfurase
MGAAARMITAKLPEYVAHMRATRDRLQKGLLNTIDDVILNGDQVDRLPNTVNAGFKYIDAEALLMMMDAEGVCVSAGSACKSGSLEPSHVLMAMNVPLGAIHGSVRFCVSRYTNEEEIDTLVQKTAKIVKRLREMSPFGKQDKPAALTREELDRHKAYFAQA